MREIESTWEGKATFANPINFVSSWIFFSAKCEDFLP